MRRESIAPIAKPVCTPERLSEDLLCLLCNLLAVQPVQAACSAPRTRTPQLTTTSLIQQTLNPKTGLLSAQVHSTPDQKLFATWPIPRVP